MREIKFRAWDKEKKKMRYMNDGEFSDNMIWMLETQELADDFEVMQYTGLKDTNGKKIYEGDILENRFEDRGVVVKEDACWTIEGFEFKHWYDLEVIGNIYDNPELLGAKNG